MISKKFGIIINIGSDLSVIAPNQSIYDGVYKNFVKSFSYSVIKHGLLGLTKYFAALYGKYNVRTNMLSPGPILRSHPKKFVNNLKNLIPTKKMNDFSDLEAAIDYLLEEKNRNTNGINLIVDGGRTII